MSSPDPDGRHSPRLCSLLNISSDNLAGNEEMSLVNLEHESILECDYPAEGETGLGDPTWIGDEDSSANGYESIETNSYARRAFSHRQWVAPALMACGFLGGVALTVGHHMHYTKLNDTVVGSAEKQQWPIRFGTAFAFLVQTCFTAATGTAYIQWVWTRCRQKGVSICAIDAAFGVDKNLFLACNWRFLSEFKSLVVLVMVFWCLPLSILITPATLSVTSSSNKTSFPAVVYTPSVSDWVWETDLIGRNKLGLPGDLTRAFSTLISTGEMLLIEPPEGLRNVSYTLDLVVPTLRCLPSNSTVRSWTAASAASQVNASSYGMVNVTWFNPHNLAFEGHGGDATSQSGNDPNTSFTGYESVRGMIGFFGMISTSSDDLWIAMTSPRNTSCLEHRTCYELFHTRDRNYNTTLGGAQTSYFNCGLRNTSMTTTVSFVDNIQSVHTSNIQDWVYDTNFDSRNASTDSFSTYAYWHHGVHSNLIYEYFVGFVGAWRYVPHGIFDAFQTSLDKTVFRTASDFSAMSAAWADDGFDLRQEAQDRNLTSLIEEFSLNASLSLMSLRRYANNVTTIVTQDLWLNKYTYSPRNLFIAYGCSIIATFIAVLAGSYAIYANGGSYDTSFSAITKTVQDPQISVLFQLPGKGKSISNKKVTGTKIRLVRIGSAERFCIAEKLPNEQAEDR